MNRPPDPGFRRLVAGLAIAAFVLVVGCGSDVPEPTIIAIPTTAPAGMYLQALVGGRIVASDRWGIALADATGQVSKVLWPNGFHGVVDDSRVALVDGAGRLVAHVGDTFRSSGGFVGANGDPDHTMLVCGEIQVSPS